MSEIELADMYISRMEEQVQEARGNAYEAQSRIWEMQKELDYYRQLEAAGRLVILPCRVGTPVYVIGAARENERAWLGVNKMRFRLSDVDKWGKTVFSTRDEAVAAAALRGWSEPK